MAMRGAADIDAQVGDWQRPGTAQVEGCRSLRDF